MSGCSSCGARRRARAAASGRTAYRVVDPATTDCLLATDSGLCRTFADRASADMAAQRELTVPYTVLEQTVR